MDTEKKNVKQLLLVMSLMVIVGFITFQTQTVEPSQSSTDELVSEAPQEDRIDAIYLCTGDGLLTHEDLKKHPEVVVVNSFAELQRLSIHKKGALWIDKNSVDLVNEVWLHQEPQKYYPLVLVGYSNAGFAFGEIFTGFGVEIPEAEHCPESVSPGFSVWMLKQGNPSSSPSFMYGYTLEPTVHRILKVTNALLYGAKLNRSINN